MKTFLSMLAGWLFFSAILRMKEVMYDESVFGECAVGNRT